MKICRILQIFRFNGVEFSRNPIKKDLRNYPKVLKNGADNGIRVFEPFAQDPTLNGCSIISVPSLRQIPGVIPKLTALYINDLNAAFSRQIFGADPEAISMPQSYDWPFNLGQLRRVLREAYQRTDGPYITSDSVNAVLEREKRNYYMSEEAIPSPAVTGTLDEITQRIVIQVFREEIYNQSRTAERLGISCTTLWRMLKDN